MDIHKMLENASGLPDDKLSELIYAVVTAAGGSRLQARAAASNPEKLKKKLNGISPEEIEELTKNIDEETMRKILDAVKQNGGLDRG